MSLSGIFYDKESADKPGRPGRSAAVLPPFCRRSAAVRAAELRSSPPRLLVVLPPPPPLSFCPAFLAPRYL